MFPRGLGYAAGAVLLGVWLGSATTFGATVAPELSLSPPCGRDNLLTGLTPARWQDVRGNVAALTDGIVAPEGAQWDAPVALVLETAAGSVTFDLGRPTSISALFVQADANDTYKIEGSRDGAPGTYRLLVEVDNVLDRGHGLRSRALKIPSEWVRFLRVGEGAGDGLFSLAEVAAYCQAPIPFPSVMHQSEAPMAVVVPRPWTKFDWWEDHASARLEMGLALATLLLLAWGYWAGRTGKDLVLGRAVPYLVAGISGAIYVAVALFTTFATTLLPAWMSWFACALWCEFTLLVTPLPARWVTPLRFVLRLRPFGRRSPSPMNRVGAVSSAPPAATVRNQLLVLLGVLSFCAYWNFGAFHFGNYTHHHEAYHYYVGSKYFEEMAYDRLYECAAIADAEEPSLRRRVELRKITNLRTNVLESTTDVLAHPERCKRHFSAERWASFKKDIEFFRSRNGVKRWEDAQSDHGYNATPVWTVLGHALASLAPASDAQLWWLTRIDPVFIVGMALMIGWAFGWRVLCLAMAVLATNFPSRIYWTGGAYLRWDWLFHMTAGVCLMKKGKPRLGGFLVAYSALLRVFPGFLLVGTVFVVFQQLLAQTRGRRWWRRLPPRELPAMLRRVDRAHVAVIAGAALAVATLVPLSLAVSGGPAAYQMFFQNSKKHASTPLTNYMGWRTVVAYKPQEAARYLQTNRLEDPWRDWKDARLRAFAHRRWLYLAGVAAFAALLYRAVRGGAPWEAAALSTAMIAVVPELTSYYYSFIVVMALLWARRAEVGLALLAVTAATGFIDWAPTQFLPRRFPWLHLQMPTWIDEQYTWMAVVTLLGMGFVLYDFGHAAAGPRSPATLPSAPSAKVTATAVATGKDATVT